MADNQTMAQLLQAPTEGYEDAIVILEINANFELKHELALLCPGMVSDEEKKIARVCASFTRQAENKRRWESNQGNNHVQQTPPKIQNVARDYSDRSNEKGGYVGKAPFYNKSDAITAYEDTQNNGNKSHNEASGSAGGVVYTTWGCSYKEFLNYQPHKFRGKVVWEMEFVFNISNCATNCQVEFATWTLSDSALPWWNSYVKTFEIDAAYEMSLRNS
ncbi:hypothetical protein Tco_1345035 [Tanacetum coccineum]